MKSTAYLVFTSQIKFYRVLYGVLNVFTAWLYDNASFKSSGITCRSPLPSSLSGKLSTNKWDSNGFFSTRKVYTCVWLGYRSNNTTGSSLIVAHWQRSFLAICACYKLLTGHCTRDTAGHYAITCDVHSCGKVTPLTLDIVLWSLWASSSSIGHAVLLSACTPRVLHYSAS